VRAEGDDFSAGAELTVFIGIDEAQARELSSTVLFPDRGDRGSPSPDPRTHPRPVLRGRARDVPSVRSDLAAEGSQIGQIEAVAGSITYAGGTQRIASRIGVGRAAEMVFTAAILPPEILASWGLINRVVPASSLTSEGRAFAQTLANGPTRAYAATKRMLHAWPRAELPRRRRDPRRRTSRNAQPRRPGRTCEPAAIRPRPCGLQQPLTR